MTVKATSQDRLLSKELWFTELIEYTEEKNCRVNKPNKQTLLLAMLFDGPFDNPIATLLTNARRLSFKVISWFIYRDVATSCNTQLPPTCSVCRLQKNHF